MFVTSFQSDFMEWVLFSKKISELWVRNVFLEFTYEPIKVKKAKIIPMRFRCVSCFSTNHKNHGNYCMKAKHNENNIILYVVLIIWIIKQYPYVNRKMVFQIFYCRIIFQSTQRESGCPFYFLCGKLFFFLSAVG